MRRFPILAALLLLGSAVPITLAALGQRWVVERSGDTRVVMGPHRMVVCDGERCRTRVYEARIAELSAGLKDRTLEPVAREKLESALERMRYNRKKGRQITIPGLVAAAFFALLGIVLLIRGRRGFTQWTRGSLRFAACGIALGLVPFALVYVDGMSHLPAEGTRSQWGASFYVMLLGSLLALAGGVVAGMDPAGRDPGSAPSAPPAAPPD